MTKINNEVLEEIHEYLDINWYDSNSFTDFNMAIDSGYTQYAAYLLVSAGTISPDVSYSPKIEHAIVDLVKDYNPKEDLEECFGNATIFVNTKTNEFAFIKNDYVDYLVDLKDMGANWTISSLAK